VADKPLTFFIDRCLTGHKFRNALRRAKLDVRALEDHFPETVQDVDWIPFVSAPPFEWVIVTKDCSILSNPAEFDALCDCMARVVMFPDQDLTADEMTDRFLRRLADVRDAVSTRDAPFVVVLYDDRVEIFP
jgi:hypothetical protein